MSETTHTHHPAQTLLNLIVTLLTPMFLAAAGGNLAFARQAAMETLTAYRVETQSDLITIAKIVGFGLAALAALSLSLAEDLPMTMMLRLHASASASDRSEHRNRQALERTRSDQPRTAPEPEIPEPDIDIAALAAAAAEMKTRTAENLAHLTTPTPEPAPAAQPVAAAQPDPTETDDQKRYRLTWAASAANIAAETAASLPTLSPEERASATIWIEVLNEAAKDFMEEVIPPRPRPGDAAPMMRPTGP